MADYDASVLAAFDLTLAAVEEREATAPEVRSLHKWDARTMLVEQVDQWCRGEYPSQSDQNGEMSPLQLMHAFGFAMVTKALIGDP